MYHFWHYLYEISTFKSPEMLAPARMPVAAGKKMAKTEKKVSPSRKSGGKFSMKIFPEKKRVQNNGKIVHSSLHFNKGSFAESVLKLGEAILPL